MSEYTPGPWKHKPSVHGNQYRYVQIGKDENYTTLEVRPADACLIATAPELLEALKKVDAYLDNLADYPEPNETLEMVRDIVAKAEGR